MAYKRCEKPQIDTTIKIWELGNPCDVYQNLMNLRDALRRKQNPWPDCDITRFDVQFQLIDAMTYMFVLTDKVTGEVYEWSVRKEYTKESAEHAFTRYYNQAAIHFNAGAYRALQDYVEALQEEYPGAGYRLDELQDGWRVFRPIRRKLGLVPFELTFEGKQGPVIQDRMIHNELWDILATIPGEPGRCVERMVRRQVKAGVVFNRIHKEKVKDYRTIVIKGWIYRNEQSHTEVTIRLQDILMSDADLAQYHEYFTE